MRKEFDVYFSGEILEGYELEEVKQAVGKLFKLSGPKLEALFAGVPVRVKKNLSVEKAGRFRKVFLESGALVQIVAAGQEPPEEPAPQPVTRRASPAPASSTGEAGLRLAPMEPLETASRTPEPRIDTSSLEIRSDEGPIESPQPTEQAPLPDISNLSMAPLEASPQSAPEPPAKIPDTGHLEIASPNTGSLEDCAEEKPAKPLPDISNLSLED
ncbi:MAG: hypothetical protein DSZ02_00545 [Gammaproteobacteria bacterium]|nr:MAG: hypothetical protein DSZ02_00545 [Gammaproteobacteria bacterium]